MSRLPLCNIIKFVGGRLYIGIYIYNNICKGERRHEYIDVGRRGKIKKQVPCDFR